MVRPCSERLMLVTFFFCFTLPQSIHWRQYSRAQHPQDTYRAPSGAVCGPHSYL